MKDLPPELFAEGRADYNPQLQKRIGVVKKREMLELLRMAADQ